MFFDWINSTFELLPGCQDELFQTLWEKKHLRFGSTDPQPHDEIDENCARLICASITNCERLLVVLPDFKPHRPALLFATALMRCLPREITTAQKKVLYFGTTIGIREHLDQVRVRGFNFKLSEVFQQQNIKRPDGWGSATGVRRNVIFNRLPQVVTIYSPADPIQTLEYYNPQLIAIDLDESPKADWLKPLLEEAVHRGLPVVAWSVNPLSECVSIFKSQGEVIVWPSQIYRVNTSHPATTEIISTIKTDLYPLVLEGNVVDSITTTLKENSKLLVEAAQRTTGRLGQDTLRQHWLYIRAFESLFVPYVFYEAEAPHFWGLKTIGHLRTACEHFRKTCEQFDPRLAAELENILISCNRIEEVFRTSDPPLWNALCSICVDEPSTDEARLIIVSGSSRKQLFLLALLAYHSITESDLNEVRTWVVTLEELRRLMRRRDTLAQSEDEAETIRIRWDLNWRPVLVGLPGNQLTSKLLPVLLHSDVDILIHPHQFGSLKRRAEEWGKAIAPDMTQLSRTLSKLSRGVVSSQPQSSISQVNGRIKIAEPVGLDVRTTRKSYSRSESLWQPDNPVESVATLLRVDDGDSDEAPIFREPQQSTQITEQDIWCNEAIHLQFKSGSSVTYAVDDFINVIIAGPSGPEVEERAVRSLRVNDRVVLIHGQQRQSFYELIISRMHQHPSMILHLGLIRRWQKDIINHYYRWSENGSRTLEQLLKRMNDRGSTLVSTATLQNWLRGYALCPQDAQDLLRLAEVLDMDFVRQNYQRIYKAASRLRGLHRGVANKLNRWLQQQARGIDSGNEDDVIDSELGLTFGDLKSSLSVQQIAAVQKIKGPLARNNLGRMEN